MRFIFTIGILFSVAGLFAQLGPEDMASDINEAFTFAKYPTYDQYVEMMQTFAEDYPDLCRLDTFGYSIQGRVLLALKISDNAHISEPEAKFLYTSSMHGDELVGFILLLRFADTLLTSYGSDSEIKRAVDSLEIWINPLSNPDGTYYPDNNATVQSSVRENANGSDLNREFPDPDAGDMNDTTGIVHENRAMMLFLQKHNFSLSANIHSGVEVVNYPWDHTYTRHPDDDWFSFISREYADEAHAVNPSYLMDFNDGITNGADWWVIYGGRQDYATYYLQGREVTLELSTIKRLPSEDLDDFWNYNHRSLLNYMSQTMYGIRGKITSALTGVPLAAEIVIPGHDDNHSSVSSVPETGMFYRLIKEGVYDLVISADGYKTDTIWGVQAFDYQSTWLNIQLDSVADPIGLPSKFPGHDLRLYPNPAGNQLTLESETLNGEALDISIFSVDGVLQIVESLPGTNVINNLNVSTLDPGFYIIRVRINDRIIVQQFIKQ